jgi:hypothetical protein
MRDDDGEIAGCCSCFVVSHLGLGFLDGANALLTRTKRAPYDRVCLMHNEPSTELTSNEKLMALQSPSFSC